MFEQGSVEEAGLLYGQCNMPREALACLRLTCQSELAISLATQMSLSGDQMAGVAEQLSGNLKREGKHSKAAHLLDR